MDYVVTYGKIGIKSFRKIKNARTFAQKKSNSLKVNSKLYRVQNIKGSEYKDSQILEKFVPKKKISAPKRRKTTPKRRTVGRTFLGYQSLI